MPDTYTVEQYLGTLQKTGNLPPKKYRGEIAAKIAPTLNDYVPKQFSKEQLKKIRQDPVLKQAGAIWQEGPGFFENITQKWDMTGLTSERGKLYAQVMQGKKDYEEVSGEIANIEEKIKNASPLKEPPWYTPTGAFGSATKFVRFMGGAAIEGAKYAIPTAGVGAGVGSVVPGVGTYAGSVTGGTLGQIYGTIKYSTEVEGGNLYGDLRQQGVSDKIAKPVASIAGLATGMIEAMQVFGLGSLFKRVGNKFVRKYIQEVVSQTIEEEVQEVFIQKGGEIIAKSIESGEVPSKEKVMRQLASTAEETFKETVPAMALIGGGIGGAGTMKQKITEARTEGAARVDQIRTLGQIARGMEKETGIPAREYISDITEKVTGERKPANQLSSEELQSVLGELSQRPEVPPTRPTPVERKPTERPTVAERAPEPAPRQRVGKVQPPAPTVSPEASAYLRNPVSELSKVSKINDRMVGSFRRAGYITIADIHDAGLEDLQEIKGIGPKTAQDIKDSIGKVITPPTVPIVETHQDLVEFAKLKNIAPQDLRDEIEAVTGKRTSPEKLEKEDIQKVARKIKSEEVTEEPPADEGGGWVQDAKDHGWWNDLEALKTYEEAVAYDSELLTEDEEIQNDLRLIRERIAGLEEGKAEPKEEITEEVEPEEAPTEETEEEEIRKRYEKGELSEDNAEAAIFLAQQPVGSHFTKRGGDSAGLYRKIEEGGKQLWKRVETGGQRTSVEIATDANISNAKMQKELEERPTELDKLVKLAKLSGRAKGFAQRITQRLNKMELMAGKKWKMAEAPEPLRTEWVLLEKAYNDPRGFWLAANERVTKGPEDMLAAELRTAPVPEGWKTAIVPDFKKETGWKGEVDWEHKRIVFESDADASDTWIRNHEIAHVIVEDHLGYIKDISDSPLMQEYAQAANIEKMHKNDVREYLAADYGAYLTDPTTVPSEIRSIFEKYLPEEIEKAPTEEEVPTGEAPTEEVRFPQTRGFEGETYKLATLSKGVTEAEADKTVEINEAEGNLAQVVEQNGKYAVYVKKLRGEEAPVEEEVEPEEIEDLTLEELEALAKQEDYSIEEADRIDAMWKKLRKVPRGHRFIKEYGTGRVREGGVLSPRLRIIDKIRTLRNALREGETIPPEEAEVIEEVEPEELQTTLTEENIEVQTAEEAYDDQPKIYFLDEEGNRTGRMLPGEVAEPEDLPSTVYHVTPFGDDIRSSGKVSIYTGEYKGGLGGGTTDYPSAWFTKDRQDAKNIQNAVRNAIKISRGNITADNFEQIAREDEQLAGLSEGALSEVVEKTMEDYTHHVESGYDEANALIEAYRNTYMSFRENAGGWGNPLLMGRTELWRHLDPDSVETLEIPSENLFASNGLVRHNIQANDFLHEVVVYGDVPITEIELLERGEEIDTSEQIPEGDEPSRETTSEERVAEEVEGAERPTETEEQGRKSLTTAGQDTDLRPEPTQQVKEKVARELREIAKEGGVTEAIVNSQLRDGAQILSAWDKDKNYLLANATGTGKTYIALTAIKSLNPDGALIVVPNMTVGDSWLEVASKFDIDIKRVKKGKKETTSDDNFYITTYADTRSFDYSQSETPPDVVVFDESHKIKNLGSQQGAAGERLIRVADNTLFMSATPFDNMVDLQYLGSLGLWETMEDFDYGTMMPDDFKRFLREHNVTSKQTRYGEVWQFNGNVDDYIDVYEKLNEQGVGSHRAIELDQNLSNYFSSIAIPDEVQTQLADIEGMFELLIFRTSSKRKGSLSATLQTLQRRIFENIKVDEAIQRATELRDKGYQVAIFTGYRSPLAEGWDARKYGEDLLDAIDGLGKYAESPIARLIKNLGGRDKVAVAHGGISPGKRSSEVESYQDGEKKIIVATSAAGGTGISLHDLTGDAPRAQINLTIPWSGREFDQVAGRSYRYGSQSDVVQMWLFALDPVERKIAGRVAGKLHALGGMVKGIEADDNVKSIAEFDLLPEKELDEQLEQDTFTPEDEEIGEIPEAEVGGDEINPLFQEWQDALDKAEDVIPEEEMSEWLREGQIQELDGWLTQYKFGVLKDEQLQRFIDKINQEIETHQKTQGAKEKLTEEVEPEVKKTPTRREKLSVNADKTQSTKDLQIDNTSTVSLKPDQSAQQLSYRIVEANDLITSHDPQVNFQYDARYPTIENSDLTTDLQERDYFTDKAAQTHVRQNANKLNANLLIDSPTPTNGAPIVIDTNRGRNVTVMGNGRGMMIKLAATEVTKNAKNKYQEYRNTIEEFTDKDLSKFDSPVLVRVLPAETDLNEIISTARESNVPETKAPPEYTKAFDVAEQLPDDIFAGIDISAEDTLRGFLRTADGRWFTNAVRDVLPTQEHAQYFDANENLTATGRTLIENVAIAKVIDDRDTLRLMFEKPGIIQYKEYIGYAAPSLLDLKSQVATGKIPSKWDITTEIPKALQILTENPVEGQPIGKWERQVFQSEVIGKKSVKDMKPGLLREVVYLLAEGGQNKHTLSVMKDRLREFAKQAVSYTPTKEETEQMSMGLGPTEVQMGMFSKKAMKQKVKPGETLRRIRINHQGEEGFFLNPFSKETWMPEIPTLEEAITEAKEKEGVEEPTVKEGPATNAQKAEAHIIAEQIGVYDKEDKTAWKDYKESVIGERKSMKEYTYADAERLINDLREQAPEGVSIEADTKRGAKNIEQTGGIKNIAPAFYSSQSKLAKAWKKSKKGKRAAINYLLRPERIAKMFDGWEKGTNYQRIVTPILKAANIETSLLESFTNETQEVLGQLSPKERVGSYYLNERHPNMTPTKAMFWYAHSQHEDNMRHLLGTYPKSWSKERKIADISEVVDSLTDNQKRVVDDIIDYFDSTLYPVLNDAYNKRFGVDLPKVEGRYFPILFLRNVKPLNPFESIEVEMTGAKKEKAPRGPRTGMTKERKGAAQGFDENYQDFFHSVGKHLWDVAHYSAFKNPVNSVSEYLESEDIHSAIRNQYGESTYKVLAKWLDHVSWGRSFENSHAFYNKFFGFLRRNFALAVLGYNLTTAPKQIASFTIGSNKIGVTAALHGLAKFTRHPIDSWRKAKKLSTFLRRRNQGFNRELRAIRQGKVSGGELLSGYADIKAELKGAPTQSAKRMLKWIHREAPMTFIRGMDRATVTALWLGAYNKVMSTGMVEDSGVALENQEQAAIDYADEVIRTTQPIAGVENLAALYRTPEFLKMFTVFSNQLNQNFNIIYEEGAKLRKNLKKSKSGKNIGKMAITLASTVFFPALLIGALSRKRPPEFEEYVSDAVIQIVGGIPFTRELTRSWGSTSVIDSMIENVRRTFHSKKSKTKMKNAVYSISQLTGLPYVQARRMLQKKPLGPVSPRKDKRKTSTTTRPTRPTRPRRPRR